MSQLVTVSTTGRVATVTFNRPEKLNAFNNALLNEFSSAIAQLGSDDSVSVIVVTGAGGNFSVGYDVDPYAGGPGGASDAASGLPPYEDWEHLRTNINRWLAVWDTPKPVISSIGGYCMGGATMLAVCSDITVLSDDAVIGWPSLPLGGGLLSPPSAWLIGPKKAKELSFIAGSRMSVDEAVASGWANFSTPAGKLAERTNELALEIAKMPLDLLRLKKLAVNRVQEQQGFRESMLAGAEWDALAHTAAGTQRMRAKIREVGLKPAIAWFHDGGDN